MHSCSLFILFPSPFGLSHPLTTMKRFAFCAIRPSIQGQHPWGHINSMVRTMPPSCQLPSASIPTREKERRNERGRERARGCDSLEKQRMGGERGRKIEKQTYVATCFLSLGEGVTVDLGLSLLNRLGHTSECMDKCGCLFAISSPQAPLQGDSLRHFWTRSVKHFASCLRGLDSKGHCRYATVNATPPSYLLVKVYGCNTLRNCQLK